MFRIDYLTVDSENRSSSLVFKRSSFQTIFISKMKKKTPTCATVERPHMLLVVNCFSGFLDWRKVLFPAETIIKDSHQVSSFFAECEFILCWIKLYSSDNHYIAMPQGTKKLKVTLLALVVLLKKPNIISRSREIGKSTLYTLSKILSRRLFQYQLLLIQIGLMKNLVYNATKSLEKSELVN